MSYDVIPNSGDIRRGLNELFGNMAGGHFIDAGIPENLELEAKFLLQSPSSFHLISDHLRRQGNIRFLNADDYRRNQFLVSMDEDTVDHQGLPTSQVRNSGYILRTRCNYAPLNPTSFIKFDRSAKSTLSVHFNPASGARQETSHARHEWESALPATMDSLRHDYGRTTRQSYWQFLAENPSLPESIKSIDPLQLRVASVIITARSTQAYLVKLDHSCAASIEQTQDVCIVVPPHIDDAAGYRIETEAEVKALYTPPQRRIDTRDISRLALDRVGTYIQQSCDVAPATQSKLEFSTAKVAELYEKRDFTLDQMELDGASVSIRRSGRDVALLQNVTVREVICNRDGFRMAVSHIPLPSLILPSNGNRDFSAWPHLVNG